MVGQVSNLEREPAETDCGAVAVATAPVHEMLAGRDVPLGRFMAVRRFLPHRDRRMVGAWCFLDHYGPEDVAGTAGMGVPPHPHTGLQTVSWLVEGEVLHRDSLGSRQVIRPGQLALMTSGGGITHSEESPPAHPPVLHGVQLWVALPERHRQDEPRFSHHPTLPVLRDAGLTATVIAGELGGAGSPASVHTGLVGADIALDAGAAAQLPAEPDFEYAAMVLRGTATVDGVPLSPGSLLYLGTGRAALSVRADAAARLLLLGGEPFEEKLVMWWNFVGRSHEEIVEAREDWVAGRRFGTVHGYAGDRLPAPPMPTTRLRPRGRHR
jgi:redox-sensitive bicupin YhaK (pirin superfamily)